MDDELSYGDIVEIRFLDHSEDGEDVLEFIVWGRIRSVTPNAYIIRSWDYTSLLDEALHGGVGHNCKTFAIVRSAIKEINVLRLADAESEMH